MIRAILTVLALVVALPAAAEEIGSVGYRFKWLGPNDKIVVEAFDDPEVAGVACYLSRADVGGISGAIALSGYDGFLYSIGFLVAWLVALLLVAELLRNSGRFTMADQLAFRMRQRPVRTAAATSTVVVAIFYLLAQMVGAGALVALLLGVSSETAKNLTIAGVGALMIFYVVVGGMRGTTWVQIVKAVLLMGGTILITVLVLAKFNFNISDMLGTAAEKSGAGKAFLEPGLKYA